MAAAETARRAGGGVETLVSPPPFGEPVEVEPGIVWLRMPLPFALDHVNLWLLEDGDGRWTAVDAGYADERSRALWEGVFAGLLGGRAPERVLATHFHPDHLGLAGWLVERAGGAPLLMSRTEWLTGRMLALDTSEAFLEAGDAYWREAGMPEEAVRRARERGNAYRRGVVVPPARVERVAAGDELVLAGSRWRVIVGEGHAPEQVTLYSAERGLLIAADQILPRISPVVGVWASTPEPDPLGDFLSSLERYRGLPEDTRVLPSHDAPFRGLHGRLDALAGHHARRLDVVRGICSGDGESATAAEVMRALFPKALDPHQAGFALAETLAHLEHLRRIGELERVAPSGQARVVARYRRR
jgi:glyoxylase-like metal-dependent hydrolase (beta-lactamase superfamily II)